MRPVTERFLRTLTGSHRMVAEARLVAPGQTGVDPDGTTIPINSGHVKVDGKAAIRSTVDLTTSADLWPTSSSDLLVPYGGTELWVRRGIEYGNGVREWVSLGYHRLWSVEQDDAPLGEIPVIAQDRMAGIVDATLTAPQQFSAATTYGTVVSSLVEDVYPWATVEWDDDSDVRTLGRALIADGSRWEFLNELITGLGKIWYWDHRGILVIKSPPDPTSTVWAVNSGRGGILAKLARDLSREGVYNGVIAVGEGADTATPVRALVVDDNPASPTYWGGPFGKVPREIRSASITSLSQAQAAAEADLLKSRGLPYNVNFGSVPNPALEPYDQIRIRYPGRSERHMVDNLVVPLVAEQAMSAVTREQQVLGVTSGA